MLTQIWEVHPKASFLSAAARKGGQVKMRRVISLLLITVLLLVLVAPLG